MKVWDIKKGKWWRTLEGHSDSITLIAMSLNGEVVISGDRRCTIMVWRVRQNKF
jgi:WD40 repeat protein